MLRYIFDMGGTSIKGIRFSEREITKEYKLFYEERVGIFQVDLKYALNLVADVLKDETETFELGISIPGIIDYKKQTVNSVSAFTNVDIDIKSCFSHLNNLKKIIIDNDGKAACLGEFHFGSDAGKYSNIGMFTIGSGVGGSVILDSKLWRGTNGMAGEFSKLYSNLESKEIVEAAMFCGTLQACYRYAIATGQQPMKVDGISFIEDCKSQDQTALSILDNWTSSLAKLIFGINFVVDLEVAYVGGGISSNEYFIEKLNEKIQKLIEKEKQINKCMNLVFKASSLCNTAACYGMLWHLENE